MESRRLAVEGAVEFRPRVFPDERGISVSPFQETAFASAVGLPEFHVGQTYLSSSRRGVVRGVHYTATPPGCAKYVHCPSGAALDVVVDLRVGSPTFGRWDAVRLDPREFRAVYLPVGVGHVFVALEDDTVISYLMSAEYVPANELAVSALDPKLGLPIPGGVEPVLSERDRVAPTLAEALAAGVLPDYESCRRVERPGAASRTLG